MNRNQIIRQVYANWKHVIHSMRFLIWIVRATEAGYQYESKKGT